MKRSVNFYKKKILFVFYSINAGGAERSLISISNYLFNTGNYEISFFIFKKSSTLREYIANDIKFFFGTSKVCKNYFQELIYNYLIFGIRLNKFISNKKFDYIVSVHEHLPEFALHIYQLLNFFKRSKKDPNNLILIVHFSPSFFIKSREKFIKKIFHYYLNKFRFKTFSKIIVVSKDIFENTVFEKSNKLKIIYNPVDIHLIEKYSKKESPYKSKNYFVHIGSIHKIKNQEFIVDSILETDENLEFEIIFIGRILERKYYQKLFQKINNTNKKLKVRFVGELDNPFPVLKNSLGLINVSMYESFSYVVHEAMVLKVPVISFIQSENSFISPENVIAISKDKIEFISKLRQIYNHEFNTKQIVERAFNYVQKFDVHKISEQYNKLFLEP